jgi:hypothetical protein
MNLLHSIVSNPQPSVERHLSCQFLFGPTVQALFTRSSPTQAVSNPQPSVERHLSCQFLFGPTVQALFTRSSPTQAVSNPQPVTENHHVSQKPFQATEKHKADVQVFRGEKRRTYSEPFYTKHLNNRYSPFPKNAIFLYTSYHLLIT